MITLIGYENYLSLKKASNLRINICALFSGFEEARIVVVLWVAVRTFGLVVQFPLN